MPLGLCQEGSSWPRLNSSSWPRPEAAAIDTTAIDTTATTTTTAVGLGQKQHQQGSNVPRPKKKG
jgi:hypothetical protein